MKQIFLRWAQRTEARPMHQLTLTAAACFGVLDIIVMSDGELGWVEAFLTVFVGWLLLDGFRERRAHLSSSPLDH